MSSKRLFRLLSLALMILFLGAGSASAQTQDAGAPAENSVTTIGSDGQATTGGALTSDDTIVVNPGMVTKMTIAVSDLAVLGGSHGSAASALPRRLSTNLNMTGLFTLLDQRAFLETNPAIGVDGQSSPDFMAWSRINAQYLVKGGLSGSGSKVNLDMRLFDVAKGTQILARTYSGPAKDSSRMMNQFTNDLLEAITGVPGVFGSQIIYASGSAPNRVVMLTELGGDEAVQVSRLKGGPSTQPSLGPGGRMAWVHRNGKNWELLVDGKVISSGPTHLSPAFRPDGVVAAAYSEAQKTSIYAFHGKGSKTLLSGLGGINVSPSFSPDGSRMVFTSNQDGVTSLFIGSASGGGGASRLTSGAKATDPSWSPAGDFITFVSRETDVCIIRPDGTGYRQLTGGQGRNHHPSFSPDGRMIVFSSTRNGRAQLFVMSANGDNQQPLMPDNRSSQEEPSWCPTMPAAYGRK
ncbi:hypothetical protein LJB99_00775 [Deltaproteobacteria bacterium OttesenSCG-928-K17]|nr:hypothetical protein [Deltaproteobacteria bacterium OttesenSCG-928-K17]